MNAVSKKELAKHCRRRTRGTDEMESQLTGLFNSQASATDVLGVPLFRDEMLTEIWPEQRKHVPCIQDPPGVSLYTATGELKKGGKTLSVYRCARGSTSLESFHLHLNRFIPGTSAGAVAFQAYLVEGLARWNGERAVQDSVTIEKLRSFDISLMQSQCVVISNLH
ncbi:Hypothetical predicted protein [Paramuricea clavata]|uniref:Uncharacterized protein n=1 Tax=Paramuricea clavata TaxID=317549 RepID=A0A7D9DYP2_PARCT|nr:Hypothetical predicted protein [Paramuricea clavata]